MKTSAGSVVADRLEAIPLRSKGHLTLVENTQMTMVEVFVSRYENAYCGRNSILDL